MPSAPNEMSSATKWIFGDRTKVPNSYDELQRLIASGDYDEWFARQGVPPPAQRAGAVPKSRGNWRARDTDSAATATRGPDPNPRDPPNGRLQDDLTLRAGGVGVRGQTPWRRGMGSRHDTRDGRPKSGVAEDLSAARGIGFDFGVRGPARAIDHSNYEIPGLGMAERGRGKAHPDDVPGSRTAGRGRGIASPGGGPDAKLGGRGKSAIMAADAPLKADQPPLRSLPLPMGLEVAEIHRDDVRTDAFRGHKLKIENPTSVASYNLFENRQRTIFVPGCPPLWTPFNKPTEIELDSGEYFRDEHAACFPLNPMEPTVAAIFEMDPTFDPTAIHIVACVSTLGDILRFSMGKLRPFTFAVHMIGRTAFFLRRNHSPEEKLEISGFGHNFHDANLTWDDPFKYSSSSHRVVQYKFGRLQILCRFEADGYLIEEDYEEPVSGQEIKKAKAAYHMSNVGTAVREDEFHKVNKGFAKVIKIGQEIRQTALLDVKTRSKQKDYNAEMEVQIPRLWLRQIPNIALAFHDQGRFDPPQAKDVEEDILKFEENSQPALARMAALLEKVCQLTTQSQHKKLEVRWESGDSLLFCEVSTENAKSVKALSHDWQLRWFGGRRT